LKIETEIEIFNKSITFQHGYLKDLLFPTGGMNIMSSTGVPLQAF
jgi:hypothetical protein